MQRFYKIIQSNYVIAAVISLLLYIFYPSISKYRWEEKTLRNIDSAVELFVDVDSDGEKERLSISSVRNTYEAISLFNKDHQLLNITNLKFNAILNSNNDIVYDKIDNKKAVNISFLGEKHDSLFLITFKYDYGGSIQPSIKTYFLDFVKSFNRESELFTKLAIDDLDGDNSKEIIILVSSKYTVMPRRMYTVNIQTHKITKSPISAVNLTDFVIDDLNNDGTKEIILHTQASCNLQEEIFPLKQLVRTPRDSILTANKNVLFRNSDCSAWLIILNSNLEYVFTPKPIRGWAGYLQAYPYTVNNKKGILSVYSNSKDTIRKPRLLLYKNNGRLIKNTELKRAQALVPPIQLKKSYSPSEEQFYLLDANQSVFIIDQIDAVKSTQNQELYSGLKTIKSSLEEDKFIFKFMKDYLQVYGSDLKLLNEFYYPGLSRDYQYVSIKDSHKQPETILICTDAYNIELKVKPNPFYKFRWLIWLLIYAVIWLLLGFVKRLFTYRAVQEKYRFEKIVKDRTEEIQKQKDDLKKLTIDLQDKNEMVFQQNQELNKRREEIESLYEKLTSSITYGKGIKDALLPSEQEFTDLFPQSFNFFRPQNVLGGDFYWIKENHNRKVLIIGDASGQGVSGAFLSLLAISILNNVNITKTTKASSILQYLNVVMYKHFYSYLKKHKDGIDMAIVILDQDKDENFTNVQFASANIPLYYFDSSKILTISKLEPNDFCIRADVSALAFVNQSIRIPKDSMLYVATKGLSKQIGTTIPEPFGKSQLRANLMRVHVLPVEEQKKIIIEKFEQWQGINGQTDDVLFIGIKI